MKSILNLLKGPWVCIVEKYNVWIWSTQSPQENEGQTTTNQPDVSTTCTSGVWKLDSSELKVDEINPKLVEGSMGMYCWEI